MRDFNDVTEQKKAEEELKNALKRVEDEKARAEAIIAAIGDGITIQDRDFKILYQNQVLIDFIGNHVGEYCYRAYEGMEHTCEACPVAMSFKDGKVHTVLRSVSTDNGMKYFENTSSALRDSDGKIIAGIEVVRDITERKKAEDELAARTRHSLLGAEIGSILVQNKNVQELLQLCTESIVKHLDAAFARIWTLNKKDNVLELQASAGMYTHINGPHRRVPVGKYKIGLIALEKKPHLTNAVIGDPRISDPEWAKREGMVAFAGHPLIVGDELVGVMAMFSKKPLKETTLTTLGSIADEIALGIERKRAEEELYESEERYRIMIEHSNDLIWMLDKEGLFTYFNNRVEEVSGHRIEDWLGKSFSSLISPTDVPQIEAIFIGTIDGKSQHYEVDVRKLDGSIFTLSVNTTPVFRAGEVVGTVSFGRDITDQKKAEKELEIYYNNLELLVQERTRELETAYKDMESFSYSVSHDLRQPLMVIEWFARNLLKKRSDKLDDHGKEKLSVIREQAGKMTQLVKDLLSFSRASTKEISKSDIDMNVLLHSITEEMKIAMGERSVHIDTKDLPVAWGDESLIRQVLVNLLSNALKYTRLRDIAKIEIGGAEKEGGNIYYVKDNGAGFNSECADELFSPFKRLHSSEEFEGTGIGLVIAKRIVNKHGGRIWAEGKVNEGATFYFTLPKKEIPINI